MRLVKANRAIGFALLMALALTGSAVSGAQGLPGVPKPPEIKAPEIKVPEVKVPDFKAPDPKSVIASAAKEIPLPGRSDMGRSGMPMDDMRVDQGRSVQSSIHGVLFLELSRACEQPACKVVVRDRILKPFSPPPNMHEVLVDAGAHRVVLEVNGRQSIFDVVVPAWRSKKASSLKIEVPDLPPPAPPMGQIRINASAPTTVSIDGTVRDVAAEVTFDVPMGEHTIQLGANRAARQTVTVSLAQPLAVVTVLVAPAAPPMISPVGGTPEWTPVTGGTIDVGCVPGDNCRPNERRRSVQVRAFEIMSTEVTIGNFEEWWRRRGKGDYERPDWTTAIPVADLPRHPAVRVTWEEAVEFCRDQKARLPRDEEWEAAARQGPGGATRMFAWDPGFDPMIVGAPKPVASSGPRQSGMPDPPAGLPGNFADQAARQKFSDWTVLPDYDDQFPYSAPVGRFLDVRGVYDLAGNVWEWTSSDDEERPGRKIIRGGSWTSRPPITLRISHRVGSEPAKREDDLGFRCVR